MGGRQLPLPPKRWPSIADEPAESPDLACGFYPNPLQKKQNLYVAFIFIWGSRVELCNIKNTTRPQPPPTGKTQKPGVGTIGL